MFRTLLPCWLTLICLFISLDVHSQDVVFDDYEDIIERSKRSIRHYQSQDYFYKHLGRETITGSGSTFGWPVKIETKRRDLESEIKELEPKVEIKPISIGLVFHVLSTKDHGLAQQQVASQIEALNRDFNMKSRVEKHPNDPQSKYLKLAGNPQISFYLADIKETNNHGSGIGTLIDAGIGWTTYDEMKSERSKGAPSLYPDKFVNIWVVNLPKGMTSYASSPYQEDKDQGIVIDASFFGQLEKADHDYTLGRTLVHLMGSYLGLQELWNLYDECSDDGVEDTPVHNAANYGCVSYEHVTLCNEGGTAMTMNFMDNTDDICQSMFTIGQVRRMHAYLQIAKSQLFTQSTEQ